jgi:hypothetical protein
MGADKVDAHRCSRRSGRAAACRTLNSCASALSNRFWACRGRVTVIYFASGDGQPLLARAGNHSLLVLGRLVASIIASTSAAFSFCRARARDTQAVQRGRSRSGAGSATLCGCRSAGAWSWRRQLDGTDYRPRAPNDLPRHFRHS